MYRVLVTGSRDYSDRDKLYDVLKLIYKAHGPFVIVNGRAKDGADQLAHEFYLYHDMFDVDCYEEPHFADWKPHGKQGPIDRGAGIKRNHKMVDIGADICIAFPTICTRPKKNCPEGIHYSHGTYDCMTYAEKRGIPVLNFGPALDEDKDLGYAQPVG